MRCASPGAGSVVESVCGACAVRAVRRRKAVRGSGLEGFSLGHRICCGRGAQARMYESSRPQTGEAVCSGRQEAGVG